MNRKVVLQLVSVTLILGLIASFLSPINVNAEASSPQIVVQVENAVLDEIAKNGTATYWVDFSSEADLSDSAKMSWSDRGWYVYETLKASAEKSQASVSAYLANAGVSYESFWIKNTMLVKNSSKVVLSALQYMPGVTSIRATKTYILYEPEKDKSLIEAEGKGVEPNIAHVQAPAVWDLGYTGEGLVVSSVDTGVRYTHTALVNQYRGNNGDGSFTHDYNWFDPYGDHTASPADDNGHGTHTMGTMVGDDGGSNQIGMAPGATWMACRGCNTSSCTDVALLACAEFIAAPTTTAGTNPNPDMRPNVVNNSWGDCSQSYDDWYQDVVDAWHAAGVYPVFSNGNSSNCGYSAPPGLNTVGNPARYGNVTGVGSSGEQNGQYASHSNWGPTDNLDTINPTDGFDEMKPQVIAPGVSIRSSVNTSDTAYQDGWTGTSMSAPHVTALIALMWQAAPCLVGDYATTENLIESSATDIVYNDGSSGTPTDFPNYASGWGEINALAAVQAASGLCGNSILTGTITSDSDVPLEGARVEITGTVDTNHRVVTTNASGVYSANVNADTYTVEASLFGFESASVSGVVVPDGETITVDLQLVELPNTQVTGVVYDGGIEGTPEVHGIPLAAKLTFSMTGYEESIYSDPFTGEYEITLYHDQEYDVLVEPIPSGYLPLETTITPTDADPFEQDFTVFVNNVACAAPGYAPDYDFYFDFEANDGGFTTSGTTSWAWGEITSGPKAGHSGIKAWATNPAGNYNANELGYITSADIDLSGFGTNSPIIEFWQWRHIESATYDNATVEVSKDGGTSWTPVYGPVGGVSDTAYNKVTISLNSTYNVSNFKLRFKFKSDSSVQYEGWYVDDIGIASASVPPATVISTYDFESSNGGFTISGSNPSWAWGSPTNGPGSAHSGVNVWATNLGGNYNNSEDSFLTSPTLDLSAQAGNAITLSFWHWMQSESNTWDWGGVQVSKDGGTSWTTVWEKFGNALTWTPKSIQLDATYAVSNFAFRFHFHSDSSVSYPGWYIDDVTVSASEPYTISVPCATIPGGYAAGHIFDANFPTSFLVGAQVTSDLASAVSDSEGVYWLFQPTASDVQEVEFTASAPKYLDTTEMVSITRDEVNVHDFYLPAGLLSWNPVELERTIFLHDDPETTALFLANDGAGNATFKLSEKDTGFEPLAVNIPAFTGEIQKSGIPSSLKFDPNPQAITISSSPLLNKNSLAGTLAAPSAYGSNLLTDMLMFIPDLSVPATWSQVGSTAASLYAGDFLGDDFSQIFAIDDAHVLYSVSTATGTATELAELTLPAGESITGLSGAEGFLYGLSSNCGGSTSLWMLDPADGSVTTIGNTGIGCGIDLAYVPGENAIYVVDIVSDATFRVDPATATATELGPTGVNANYAQDLDYDEESGVLYWAAYTSVPELRVIDLETGASALVAPFASGEVDAFAIPTGGSADVPWLSESPSEGSAPSHEVTAIQVTFDVAGIEQPGDYSAEIKIKQNTPYPLDSVPVTLHVIRPFNWGNFKGDVIATEKCDLDPHPLEGATVNFIQNGEVMASTMTDEDGHYSYSLVTGTYDIELASEGYVTMLVEDVYLGPSMDIVQDFTTRLDQACLSVEPTEISASQQPGMVTTQSLVLTNTGAHEAVFEIGEIAGQGPIIDADVELILDDGSAEDGIGIGGTLEFIFLNKFTPDPELFPFNLEQVQVYWDSSGSVQVGDEFQIAIYSNVSGSDDPAVGSELLYKFPVTASVLDQFETYDLPEPVAIEGPGDVLIGVVAMTVPGSSYFPASIDENESQERSWAGWWTAGPPDDLALPPDESWGLIDDFGFPGNWLVRGLGSIGATDIVWLTEDPIAGVVPPDGATVESTLTFDSTGLTPGRYTGKLSIKNQPDPKIVIPVELLVETPDNYGTLQGTVLDLGECNNNPEPLAGATVTFYIIDEPVSSIETKADGTYKVLLPAGLYTVEVSADGFETRSRSNISLTPGETEVRDFGLRIMAPCLTVVPGEIEQYMLPDTTGEQFVKIINTGPVEGLFEISEFGIPVLENSYTPPTFTYRPELDLPEADKSKTSSVTPSELVAHNAIADVLLDESFETSVPPTGWELVQTAPTTWLQGNFNPHTGTYYAHVLYDAALNQQDEWLLTPEFALAEGTLTVWSGGSVYWCRDTYDNCDLSVWIVVGDVGGEDDIFIQKLEDDWSNNWMWDQTTIDLSSFLPGGLVRIGFQYYGLDGAEAYIDDVVLDGVESADVPWLTEDPLAGTVPPDSSLTLTLGYDTTGLTVADYYAQLLVKNDPNPRRSIPVTLHVVEVLPTFSYFVPMLIR